MDEKRAFTPPQVSGYSEAGASLSRRALKGFRPNSGSPTDDIDLNNRTLRQRSRMLYMASPIATSAINTNRTKVVGPGLHLKSTINYELLGISRQEARNWQKKTEAEFSIFASKPQHCDAIGMNDFYGLQQLALKSWLLSGDCFALVKRYSPTPLSPYSLRLHMIEADRISTPHYCGGFNRITSSKIPDGYPGAGHEIHDGVEVDANGLVVAYHICNAYPTQYTLTKHEWTRVEAYGRRTGLPNVMHITDTERCDQYRGVPYLAPIIEMLLQFRRYTESELMAALVQSFFTAWIETETNQSIIPVNEVGASDIIGANGEAQSAVPTTGGQNDYAMSPGSVIHLKPGEKIHFGNPNIPTAGFETFTKTICKVMGAGLEIPYDVLLKEFNASYSASRAALLEAWEAIKMRRVWLVNRFCQPVYELWLTEAVARGRIKAPGFFEDPLIRNAWCKTLWIGPVQGQLDPKKEAEASLTLAGHGVKTHESITTELGGGDWESNMAQLQYENELLSNMSQTKQTKEEEP